MTCVICKNGETKPGTTTLTLEREDTTIVFKHVPAKVCENCGEAYLDEETTQQLLNAAEAAVTAGVQVEVRAFVVA